MSHNILIAYYSHSGNTERVARCIAEITGGDLYLLQPAEAYPATYQKVLKQARNEIRSGYLPRRWPLFWRFRDCGAKR